MTEKTYKINQDLLSEVIGGLQVFGGMATEVTVEKLQKLNACEEDDPAELDKLAAEVYDWCLARQQDNLKKDGTPGDPRKVGKPYEKAHGNVKRFYRSVAEWCLSK